jgi:hypothetical protein
MQEISKDLYHLIYESVSLRTMGIIVGLGVLILHVIAWLKPAATKEFLLKLPRSQSIGTWILTAAFLLGILIATAMDLGDFARMRAVATWAVPIIYLSLLFYCNDYLGARSLGILILLIACPILNAAYLQPPASRALLSGLVYAWILLALFWVGMPHTLRDQVTWLTSTPARLKLATIAGITYGIALIGTAVTFWA